MDNLTTREKIFIGVFTVVVMLGLRAANYFYKDLQVEDFMMLGFSVLTALGVTHLNDTKPPAGKAQGGFVHPILLAGMALFLVGCAGLNAQGVLTVTYNTPQTITSTTLTPGMAALPVALVATPAASAASSPASVPAK